MPKTADIDAREEPSDGAVSIESLAAIVQGIAQSVDNLSKQVKAETEKIEAEIGRAKSEIFNEANAELEKNIELASKAMQKARGIVYFDKKIGVVNTYNHTAAVAANKQWREAIQKQRDLRDGTIKAEFALIEAKEFKERLLCQI